MSRLFITLLASWSLVAGPALCRLGTAVACCEVAFEGCCPDEGAPCEGEGHAPAPRPADRECASCADFCRGAAKPYDDHELWLVVDDGVFVCVETHDLPTNVGPVHHSASSGAPRDTLRLPYQPSDIPLLI